MISPVALARGGHGRWRAKSGQARSDAAMASGAARIKPAQEQDTMKEERLQEIVQHAYAHSPAFRERLDGAGGGRERRTNVGARSRGARC